MSSSGSEAVVVTWNFAWRSPRGRIGRLLGERVEACSPDVVCLTEAYLSSLGDQGHVVGGGIDEDYPVHEGRRKVLLWSRKPWRDTDQIGHPDLPSGRFVKATTDTPIGPLIVLGICIPWAHAHVSTGRRDRKPWEDHRAYIEALGPLLRELRGERVVLMGDFNQRIPPGATTPKDAAAGLAEALKGLEVATRGRTFPLGDLQPHPAIDHIVHSPFLRATEVFGLSNVSGGQQLSDHFGICSRISLALPSGAEIGARDPCTNG